MKGLSDTYVESVIRAFAEGRMTARQAAAKLGITRQYANRLRKAYAEEGPPCLRHGNSGRTSPLRTDPETEGRIVSLYKGKYDTQSGVLYNCTRDSGPPLSHDLSALVGLYGTIV